MAGGHAGRWEGEWVGGGEPGAWLADCGPLPHAARGAGTSGARQRFHTAGYLAHGRPLQPAAGHVQLVVPQQEAEA